MNANNSDDKEIEAEIQRALDALDLDDGEGSEKSSQEGELDPSSLNEDLELTNEIPACLSEFIVRAQSRADGIQQELSECDALLASVVGGDEEKREEYFYQSDELKEYAFQIGEDPEELRDRVIRELDADDDDGDSDTPEGPGVKILSLEGPLFEGEKVSQGDGKSPQNGGNAISEELHGRGSGNQEDSEPLRRLEDAAKKTVREFKEQFDSCLHQYREGYEEGQRSTLRRERLAEQSRAERIKQNNDEQQKLAQQRMVHQTELQEDLDWRNRETEALLAQYQSEIREMDARTKQEKLAFLEQRLAHQKSLSERMAVSATKIQAVYRSYRARKPYREKMRLLRENVKKKLADKRQTEIATERKILEQRRKKERDDKRRTEEEERRRREEEERREREEERLRKEASEREERERALEQERKQETEERERRWEEERKERERRETEEKANLILAKMAREKKEEEEGKKIARSIDQEMDIHDEVINIHDREEHGKRTDGVNLDAHGTVDCPEECVDRGNTSEEINVDKEGSVAEDVINIHEDVSIHEESNINEVVDTQSEGDDQLVGQGPGNIQGELSRSSGRKEENNSGIHPAVTVTIMTGEDINIDEGEVRIESSEVGELKKSGSVSVNRDKVGADMMAPDDHWSDKSHDVAVRSAGEAVDIDESKEGIRHLNMYEFETTKEIEMDMVPDEHRTDDPDKSHGLVGKSPGQSHDGITVGHTITQDRKVPGQGMVQSVQYNKDSVEPKGPGIVNSPKKGKDSQTSPKHAGDEGSSENQTFIPRNLSNPSTELGNSIIASEVPTAQTFPVKNVVLETGESAVVKEETTDLIKQGALIGQTALPKAYEKARIKWMETSTPFSKSLVQAKDNLRALEKRKRRYLRRPSALKKMAPVTEEKILEACPDATTLAEVTTLKLSDLSGCTLSTLANCPRLEALACRRSQLQGLEGLGTSPDVTYIDFKGNHISFVSCRDLSRLTYLDLSENELTTIHGLEGCSLLKWLDLSRNKITRLSGIEGLIALSHLDLSNNQLINVHGLSSLVHLVSLDLSDNHLSTVPGLESCPLLQRLNLIGNSISKIVLDDESYDYPSFPCYRPEHEISLHCIAELLQFIAHFINPPEMSDRHAHNKPPELSNHVLLTEMFLDNNSLVTMETIQTAWLPRLQTLSLAQNSLSVVPVLEFTLSLRRLDLRNNYITDVSCLGDGLSRLPYLEELLVDGNPVTEERECRDGILRLVPSLSLLDDDVLSAHPVNPQPLSQFEVMCRSQVRATDALRERHGTVLRSIEDDAKHLESVATVWGRFLDCSQKMAVDHRYMHEYGDLSLVQFLDDDLSRMIPGIGMDPRGQKKPSEGPHTNSGPDLRPTDPAAAEQHVANSCDKLGGAIRKLPSSDRSTIIDDNLGHKKSPENGERSGEYHRRDKLRSRNAPDRSVLDSSDESLGADRNLPFRTSTLQSSGGHVPGSVTSKDGSHSGESDVNSNMLFCQDGEPRVIRQGLKIGNIPPAVDGFRVGAAISIQSVWRGYQVRRDIARHTKRYLAAVTIQALWRGQLVRSRYKRARAALKVVESDEDEEFGNDVDLELLDYNEEALDKEWFPSETPDVPMSHPVLPARHPSSPHRPVSSVALDVTSPPSEKFMPRPPKQAWRGASHETLSGKPPLPPVTPSTSRGESSLGSTARTVRSKKEQQLTEEWGFRDNQTAELMMKRAKKMNKGNKKKSLDPIQKLRMMKKAHEANTTPAVQPQTRRGIQRREYFKAKDDARDAVVHEVDERTHQWVHSQVPNQELQHPPLLDSHHTLRGRHSSSESNLPRMSLDVLQGRVQLVASPSLELESVDGLSVHGGGAVRARSNSLTSPEGNRSNLPSVKTNSAPTDHIRQRQSVRAHSNKRR